MDTQSAIIETATNHDIEARRKFESFKLGNGLPSALKGHRPAHTRSRSRNMSISSASSLSIPPPKPSPPSSEDPVQGMSSSSQAQALAPSSRRNSHHRRRSSVSTRHESAEMMGVSLPDLPASSSDDFGDKDSIRRRALWALEGKPDVPFSKVEIPELSSPQMEKFMSDLPVKPTFPTVSGLSNLLSNKRDSFKLLSSASSTKDQLHTLVEEDEEEEDGPSPPNPKHVAVATSPLPAASLYGKGQVSVKPVLNSSRPTSLNLRPLLTSERFLTHSNQVSLSTRETTTRRTGLKTLSLSLHNSVDALAITEQRSQSFSSPPPTDSPPSLNDDGKVKRRSSICYKTSSVVAINHAGLPTPAMTPIHTDRHFSLTSVARDSGDDECFSYDQAKSRPLSTSEQSFLVKSHHALLARISDLERALAMKGSTGYPYRADTRPTSLTSEFSITSDQTLGEPADEMLQLVSDLKAERDEYKRDVDAWRLRVKDMENKLSSMAKRVETERRQAWIAQSRAGLIEVEKSSLEKKIECHEATLTKMENEKRALERENRMLHGEITRALSDLARANTQLEKAQQEIEAMRRSKSAHLPPTPDSSDEDDGLILYEESDMSFQTSSGDSIEELSKPTPFFAFNTVGSSMFQSPPSTPDTITMHDPKHTLSKTWTFPAGAPMASEPRKAEPDKFFGCLESGDEASNGVTDPDEYNYERSKGLFSAALKAYKDDPDAALIGLAVESQSSVAEEGDQDGGLLDADEDMFGEAGGICITLTPAQDNDGDVSVPETSTTSFQVSSPEPPMLPPLNFGSLEHEAKEAPKSMSIDFSRYDVSTPAKGSRSSTSKTASTKCTSPSSIPRLRSCSKTGSSSPPVEHAPRHTQISCSTPPMKRTIPFPSLIPQAISSPSPIRIANVFPRPRLSPLTLTQSKQQSSVPSSSRQGFPRFTNGNDCDQALEDPFNPFSLTPFTTSTERHALSPFSTGKCIIPNPNLPPNSKNPITDQPPPSSSKYPLSLQNLTSLIPSSWTSRLFSPRSKSIHPRL